jgi:PhnB protein
MKGIPEGASVIIPRLVCRDPAAAIAFCANVFGAVERVRRPGPEGTVAHALMTIGPAMVMIESEWPTLPSRAPPPDASSPVVIFVYVEDADRTVARAEAAGAKILVPLQNQFWGDRTAWIVDPSGHVWTIATRIEETTEQERKDRWSAALRADAALDHTDQTDAMRLALDLDAA